jgi:hypothetical protein
MFLKNLLSETTRQAVEARVGRLDPSARPLWGQMNATSMLAHCSAQLRMSWGEIECQLRASPFGRAPLKQLLVYLAPWPKSAPTAPELIQPEPDIWDAERDQLLNLIGRFKTAIQDSSTPHPIFGKLSKDAWGRLAYRHLDHHLRQFGV